MASAGPAAGDQSDSQFRPDIDGLRTVAVTLVVAFHAGVLGFGAGFIGVDVFFVISGFLINRLLLREIHASGTVALWRFWARRARRLLPASAAMVLGVIGASWLVLPPLRWEGVAKAAVASSAYVSNAWFARQSTNYFAADLAPTPLLHTWSLSVEEQFYVFWPFLLLAAVRLARGTGGNTRRWLLAIVGGGAALSFSLCLWFTLRGSPWAFFGSPLRAWEFAAGALVALGERPLARYTRPAFAWAGLIVLIAGLVVIDEGWRFPGVAALFPVLGTVLLLIGAPTSLVGRMLTTAPFQWLGKRSYAWYLWHWPAIVIADAAFPEDSGAKLVAAAASLVVSAVTYALVEQPLRFHPKLVHSTGRSLALAAATVAVGCAVGFAHWASYRQAAKSEPVASALAARRDKVAVGACEDYPANEPPSACTFGERGATRTVLVVGDSHAMQWVPALDLAGQRLGVRVVFMGRSACPAPRYRVIDKSGTEQGACARFQAGVAGAVRLLRPELVVTSNYSGYVESRRAIDEAGRPLSAPEGIAAWGRALAEMKASVEAAGSELRVIGDPPILRMDPVDCLAGGSGADACTALARRLGTPTREIHEVERAAVGEAWFDPVPFCGGQPCPLVRERVIVYRDKHHVTGAFSRAMAGAVEEALRPNARPDHR